MKRFINMTISLAAAFLLAASCEQEPKSVFVSTELGAVQKTFDVSFEPGIQKVEVYSNSEYSITLADEQSWVSFPASSKGDEGFEVEYEENESYPRRAMFILSIGEQKDTVTLRQAGLQNAYLTIGDPAISPKGSEASSNEVALTTNVDIDKILISTVFETQETSWLKNIRISDSGSLCFEVEANPTDKMRKAQIGLSFIDGWDNKVTTNCYVTQMTRDDVVGREVTFEQVRAIGEPDPGVEIKEDIIISGVIISDVNSRNVGENPRNTMTYIDYSQCEKYAYLQSTDGQYGFKIETTSISNNIFKRYDNVKINLNGATVVKHSDPEYYDISGITSFMVVSLKRGSASDVPSKQKHIRDLVDSDIYTWVELQDCELPVRKGSMTPVNEGYTIAGNAARSTKYPLLMRDVNGDDMYILTNTTCPYRRTGKRLPYGSGPMSGVIVNELHPSFNYQDNDSDDEDSYGNIGRYQIRHMSLDDFGMDPDFKNSFSGLITEYRFCRNTYQATYLPTYGTNGYLTHSFKYTASSTHGAGNTAIIKGEDFSYLGPIGTNASYAFGKNTGNVNGLGIIIDGGCPDFPDGYDWGNAAQGADFANINTSEAGKGKSPTACGGAFRCWYNWDKNNNRGYAWIVKFSTLDVPATDQLSMQLGMLNCASTNGSSIYSYAPRYWQIQWSITGRDQVDSEWTTIVDKFMVPDTVNWTPATYYWQSPGYKTINVRLPLEMLNRPEVYVRIRPVSNLVGDYTHFAVTPPGNNSMAPSSQINYIGIRYNK